MRKTTWKDYHNGNVEKRDISCGILIKEACGRSRVKARCPFCNTEIELYLWHCEKRCETCGAICAGAFAFKALDNSKESSREAEEKGND